MHGQAIGATAQTVGGPPDAVGEQISNYDAMVTWFPMERGLFLRGGAGLTNFRVDADAMGLSASNSVNGVNITVGGGYAFWLGRTFNLTLNLDYSAQFYFSNRIGAPGWLPESIARTCALCCATNPSA